MSKKITVRKQQQTLISRDSDTRLFSDPFERCQLLPLHDYEPTLDDVVYVYVPYNSFYVAYKLIIKEDAVKLCDVFTNRNARLLLGPITILHFKIIGISNFLAHLNGEVKISALCLHRNIPTGSKSVPQKSTTAAIDQLRTRGVRLFDANKIRYQGTENRPFNEKVLDSSQVSVLRPLLLHLDGKFKKCLPLEKM